MKLIGRSKISKLNPKHNITYPILRLPQDQADVIGEMAYVYETECNGLRAFLVMLDEIDPVACGVIQLDSKNDLEIRVNRLESKMDEIVRVIGENGNKSESKPEKDSDSDGLVVIRTRDLRRVKATS